MAHSVTHPFVSPVADAGDPNEVGPNEWNAGHSVSIDPALVSHNGLADLATGDPHSQYRLESADHTHESTGLQGGVLADAAIPSTIARDTEVAAAVTAHEALANPHPTYETAAEALAQIATHAGQADPHTGYRLESADHSHLSTGLEGGLINEAAQDAVGAMAANSAKVTLSYVDATPSLTADIVAGSLGPADIANRTRTDWVPAGAMSLRAGAPVLAAQGAFTRYEGWTFRDAQTDAVAFSLRIPQDFVSVVSWRIWWTNIGAGAGNVMFGVTLKGVTDAEDLNSTTGESSVTDTVAAPAQDIAKVSTTTAAPSVTAAEMLRGVIERLGSNAADTLTNSIALLAFELVYTADM